MFIQSLTSVPSNLQIGDGGSKSSGTGKLLRLNLCMSLLSLSPTFPRLLVRMRQACRALILATTKITIMTTMSIQVMKGPPMGHLDL